MLLGGALVARGTAVTDIRRTLARVAEALGAPSTVIVVFPTAVFVGVHGERSTSIDLAEAAGGEVLFDKAAAISEVAHAAASGTLSAVDGIARLREITARRPRFPWPVRLLGHGLISAGAVLLFAGYMPVTIVAAFVLGMLVGGMKLLVRPGSYAAILLPVVSSFVVAMLAFLGSSWGWWPEPLWILIPALITLLPGGLLTVGVQELAAGDMLSGSARLVTGVAQLVLFAFSILAAVSIVGLPNWLALSAPERPGPWAPWAGVIVMALGFFLYFCGPRFSLFYLTAALLAAYGGQLIGTYFGSAPFGGLIGAFLLTVIAYVAQSLPGGPPAVVCFLPAFWLLVPGASGLIGLAQSAGGAGATITIGAIGGTIVAIALGVLVGIAAYRVIYALAPRRLHLRLV